MIYRTNLADKEKNVEKTSRESNVLFIQNCKKAFAL